MKNPLLKKASSHSAVMASLRRGLKRIFPAAKLNFEEGASYLYNDSEEIILWYYNRMGETIDFFENPRMSTKEQQDQLGDLLVILGFRESQKTEFTTGIYRTWILEINIWRMFCSNEDL
jgi:hypothetical protein